MNLNSFALNNKVRTMKHIVPNEKLIYNLDAIKLSLYMSENFPDMMADIAFINDRAISATRARQEAINSNYPLFGADEIAHEVLMEGFHVSPFHIVSTSLNDLDFFSNEKISDDIIFPLAYSITFEDPEIMAVFNKYKNQFSKHFEDSLEYEQMCAEVAKLVNSYEFNYNEENESVEY